MTIAARTRIDKLDLRHCEPPPYGVFLSVCTRKLKKRDEKRTGAQETRKGGRERDEIRREPPSRFSSNKDDDGAQSGHVRLRSDPDQTLKSSAQTDDPEGTPSRHASRASKPLPQVNPHRRIRGSSSPRKKSSPSLSWCLYSIAGGMSTKGALRVVDL